MKKKIDMLTQLLENNGISLLDSSKKREGGSSSEDRERVHALVASTSSSPSFIIDSGASRHMVSTKEAFSSIDMSKVHQQCWEMTLSLTIWGKEGLILTMVSSVKVLPLTSC